MKIYEFNCSIITPLFMGGFGQKAEIRAASVKGALRWWFRALYGGQLYSISPQLSSENLLEKLHDKESELFGSTKNAGIFSLQVIAPDNIATQVNNRDRTRVPDVEYGFYGAYGLLPTNNKDGRSFIQENQSFRLRLIFKKEEYAEMILASLAALNLFGGLGSRSTRGFGSINFTPSLNNQDINDLFPPLNKTSRDTIGAVINSAYSKILGKFNIPENKLLSIMPEYSIICPGKFSYSMAKTNFNNQKEALKNFSEKLRKFRENPQEPSSRPRVWHSYDYQAVFGNKKIPSDTIFGLPHNFRTSGYGNANLTGSNSDRERRVSPLRLKVHKLSNGYVNLLVLFEAKFLPDGDKIKAGKKELNLPDFTRATQFLNEYCGVTL